MSDTASPDYFEVDKMHAAHRQLNVAIRLHYESDDPVAVVTLAGAASGIFSDLVQLRCPDKSWDRHAQQVAGLTPKEYFAVMRKAQNFLKHADEDPEGIMQWSSEDTEALMMWTVMNAGELDLLSTSTSVFQLWYIAKHPQLFPPDHEVRKRAVEVFPGLDRMSPAQQRAFGAERLQEELARVI